ncbi:SprT family zinc-dependent metalloprotease [Aminobacterium sp. MB27-C1]|uniref:M48 family metallopeptidase n=1 Tax=Aminobacterium sp. MB27-C1 TaxID=3070661 RepID=UPI0027DCB2CA|nr:SprT family zinc-dependent metalloprotease [Aminobacterium sp. MB27-C1]WMI72188.1 SprT family zinc-dependent metalloprotease [Aminobacterium sp. MB27-C1]
MPLKCSIKYGKEVICFHLIYSNRKTIEISVFPDLSVVVKAPSHINYSVIEKRIKKRANWIKKQQKYFEQFTIKTSTRSYIGGETHLYLGKQYRLKISVGNISEVKLTRGYFLISCKNEIKPEKVKQLMDNWYREKAREEYEKIFYQCWPYFEKLGFSKPQIKIRQMKTRWGSLSKRGNLTLNLDLIKVPKECIEYVITHELCHLRHYNHSADFYNLLEKFMPDWKRRKHKLELTFL